jgi:adenine-specific DNA methylase
MSHVPTFIETQFPVSKLSKESYKERKANYSQTLTGLGKWWGRKPLVLVRAALLGLLLPATDNPKCDRDIFLKLMTMDEEGLWLRRNKNFSVAYLFQRATPSERSELFTEDSTEETARLKRRLSAEQKQMRETLERRLFDALSYDENLEYCDRPEQIDGPRETAWEENNAHLGTHAHNLPELVRELGERRFGQVPRVGDAFCGGGSVPFEAARLGCEAYGSDLNPVAALLTWGALNIVGGGEEVAKQVSTAQREVYDAVDRQIRKWGIEHNEQGWRADAYLYCAEVTCPECGWRAPLAPSWVIGEKTKTIAVLTEDLAGQRFDIAIKSGASDDEMRAARLGTARDSELHCPHCKQRTAISALRGDGKDANGFGNSLRLWEKDDIEPRAGDVFGERLYCIRWIETRVMSEKTVEIKHYRAPTDQDFKREQKVLALLRERFCDWQAKGYIPNLPIEPGDETTRLMRERGWTHWHHLFNPRQLLVLGLISEQIHTGAMNTKVQKVAKLIGLNRSLNFNSRLTRWVSNAANEKGADTFANQALNTLHVYICRPFPTMSTLLVSEFAVYDTASSEVTTKDARSVDRVCNIWITDPPYADAVNYHELSEYFLSWFEKHIPKLFPDWYLDSKRALAVVGEADSFRQSMVACYRNLTDHMPDSGLQVVMFTHQDATVWADLALILWAAGLRVSAAWTIATETETAMKVGNYVQGTVLLVLRKRTSDEAGFLDEINADIKPEVERQLASMLALDDQEDPNFSDSDYQLAAYAAALRVLTQYARIEEIDIERELTRPRAKVKGEKSPIETAIENAVKIASNFLIPKTLHDSPNTRAEVWRNLSAEERFYVKGLEVESHGELRQGVYQEFARGFGVRDYTQMLASDAANEARLKTATEFKSNQLGTAGFGQSLLRQCLFAAVQVRDQERADVGLRWLKDEVEGDYWSQRATIIALLRYLARLPMPHWREDAQAAYVLAGAVENDSV